MSERVSKQECLREREWGGGRERERGREREGEREVHNIESTALETDQGEVHTQTTPLLITLLRKSCTTVAMEFLPWILVPELFTTDTVI